VNFVKNVTNSVNYTHILSFNIKERWLFLTKTIHVKLCLIYAVGNESVWLTHRVMKDNFIVDL